MFDTNNHAPQMLHTKPDFLSIGHIMSERAWCGGGGV
jgi:hypothetical protein